jgi:hypothetical protein
MRAIQTIFLAGRGSVSERQQQLARRYGTGELADMYGYANKKCCCGEA